MQWEKAYEEKTSKPLEEVIRHLQATDEGTQ